MKIVRILGALCLILLEVVALKAQKITPAEINAGSGAGASSTANIKIEYTLGNGLGISVLNTTINLTVTNGRMATEEEVSSLPEELQEQILKAPAGIKAWPVPSEGEVSVLLEGLETGTEAMVYDQQGKLIQSLEILPNDPVKLERLKTGIYFLRTANKEIPTVRLVVR